MSERRPLPGARPPRSCLLRPARELPAGHAPRILCFGHADSDEEDQVRIDAVMQQLGLEEDSIWVAESRDGALGAAGLVYNPGGAVVFGSPMVDDQDVHLVAAAIDAACRHADPIRASLVEGIVRPHDVRIRRALELSGFDFVTEIRDLRAPVPTAPPAASSLSRLGLQLEPHDGTNDSLFTRALGASFVDSDDYDAASAKRTPVEHLRLIRWRRQFDPALWRVVLHAGEPVGMWALHVEADALELAYIGLAPAWRNQSVGRALLDRTFSIASELGLGELTCVVKAANDRALRFYQRAGFEVVGRRSLLSRLDW